MEFAEGEDDLAENTRLMRTHFPLHTGNAIKAASNGGPLPTGNPGQDVDYSPVDTQILENPALPFQLWQLCTSASAFDERRGRFVCGLAKSGDLWVLDFV